MTLQEIYNQYNKLVYNLALQYVHNIEDAEEITQDVFVAVHHSINNFRNDSKISTWIYRITINKSLDFLKSKNRKKRFAFVTSIFKPNSSELMFDKPNFNHPGVEMEHKESLELLFLKINSLPDNQKTALILNKIEQKNVQECAEIMNLSAKAVESLIHRAKQNLLKKIEDEKRNKK